MSNGNQKEEVHDGRTSTGSLSEGVIGSNSR